MSGEIRRAPGSDGVVRSTGPSDEAPAPGGGVFRRLAPREGSGLGVMLSGLDLVFAPNHQQAREEIQRQRTAGARAPSDTDPPGDDDGPAEGRVAAAGRRGTPFSGYIVIRRHGS